jgi:hypothetical protein
LVVRVAVHGGSGCVVMVGMVMAGGESRCERRRESVHIASARCAMVWRHANGRHGAVDVNKAR